MIDFDLAKGNEIVMDEVGANRLLSVLTTDQWKEGGRNFNILNLKKDRYFTWQDQVGGVNLGFTNDNSEATARKDMRWWFRREDGSVSPLQYKERFALGGGASPSFLRYAHRTVGANLSYDENPEFAWSIYGGGIGSPVNTNVPIAIFNTQVERGGERGDFLIYFDRPVGGDVGWTTTPTVWNQMAPYVKEGIESAIKMAVAAL